MVERKVLHHQGNSKCIVVRVASYIREQRNELSRTGTASQSWRKQCRWSSGNRWPWQGQLFQ